jgi:hypothetical protein
MRLCSGRLIQHQTALCCIAGCPFFSVVRLCRGNGSQPRIVCVTQTEPCRVSARIRGCMSRPFTARAANARPSTLRPFSPSKTGEGSTGVLRPKKHRQDMPCPVCLTQLLLDSGKKADLQIPHSKNVVSQHNDRCVPQVPAGRGDKRPPTTHTKTAQTTNTGKIQTSDQRRGSTARPWLTGNRHRGRAKQRQRHMGGTGRQRAVVGVSQPFLSV